MSIVTSSKIIVKYNCIIRCIPYPFAFSPTSTPFLYHDTHTVSIFNMEEELKNCSSLSICLKCGFDIE